MSWVAVAIGGAALLGYAGSQQAASTQAGAQQQAAATQQGMFNTVNQQEQPFIQAGYGATTGLNQLMGLQPGTSNTGGLGNGYLTQQFTPQTFLNSPQYQFQQQQGAQAIRNADTPGVGALSGAALKDLMNFNQGLASTYYGNYFNMQQTAQNNIFSRLSGLAGLGQNAATQVGTSGTQLGTGIAQAQAGAGASLAGGIVGGTNSLTSGLNNGAAYLQLGSLMSGGGGGAGPGTGAYTYGGTAYNNPSAYVAGGA
ncbi:MAG: DNA transfer protein p32 [Betaproteobacteria bacterium]|nr:DNA transfer protein p32 [Betaproteobacteria bacterium]